MEKEETCPPTPSQVGKRGAGESSSKPSNKRLEDVLLRNWVVAVCGRGRAGAAPSTSGISALGMSCLWRTYTCTHGRENWGNYHTECIFRPTVLTREKWQPTERGREPCPDHLPITCPTLQSSALEEEGERHLRTRLFSNQASGSVLPWEEGKWDFNWEKD